MLSNIFTVHTDLICAPNLLFNKVRCCRFVLLSAASMSAMERTELKMAVIAEQLGLSWAGEETAGVHELFFYVNCSCLSHV